MVGLTLFTPVRRRWLPISKPIMHLGKWVKPAQRNVLQFQFIHAVRWTYVRDLPYNGSPQERERLPYSYLFFESNFDGPWQHYIDAFAYIIPSNIRGCWGRGPDFPAPPPAGPLKDWIARNSMEGGHYYCAYPYASTRMVCGALEVRERFEALRTRADDMSPEEFKQAYEDFLTDVQVHL